MLPSDCRCEHNITLNAVTRGGTCNAGTCCMLSYPTTSASMQLWGERRHRPTSPPQLLAAILAIAAAAMAAAPCEGARQRVEQATLAAGDTTAPMAAAAAAVTYDGGHDTRAALAAHGWPLVDEPWAAAAAPPNEQQPNNTPGVLLEVPAATPTPATTMAANASGNGTCSPYCAGEACAVDGPPPVLVTLPRLQAASCTAWDGGCARLQRELAAPASAAALADYIAIAVQVATYCCNPAGNTWMPALATRVYAGARFPRLSIKPHACAVPLSSRALDIARCTACRQIVASSGLTLAPSTDAGCVDTCATARAAITCATKSLLPAIPANVCAMAGCCDGLAPGDVPAA